MIKVAVSGAKGRMGQEVVKAVLGAGDMELVAQIDMGDDLGAILKSSGAQAVVDFTTPSSMLSNILTALDAGVVPVVGTTGLTESGMDMIKSKCAETGTGILLAPNFAIGAVLMMRFAKEAAKYLPDAEIVEMHHEKKLDSPSGTAVLTAARIAEGRAGAKRISMPENTHGLDGARGADIGDVPVHSIRLQGFVASQFVTFGGLGQTLTIRHDSIDRTSFMPGVLLALRNLDKIHSAKSIIYGLENLLD